MPLTEFHAPDYFVDGHRVQSVRIDPDRIFPGLGEVAKKLFEGASPERSQVEEYARALNEQGRLTPPVQEAVDKAETIRDQTTAIVYVAGPLTGVSEELKARYGQVSDLLMGYEPVRPEQPQAFFGYVPHLHGTDPVKHPNVTPAEVRDIDYLWAKIVADYHVNFLEPTAHGNAIELGWAESSMIPSINLNPTGNRLSRLTLGMNNVARLVEYQVFEKDGLSELKTDFDEVHAWLREFPDRDPREFYYMGYQVLGQAILQVADRAYIEETGRSGVLHYPATWFVHLPRMMAYIRDSHDAYYGHAGEIQDHGWMDDGLTILFC